MYGGSVINCIYIYMHCNTILHNNLEIKIFNYDTTDILKTNEP